MLIQTRLVQPVPLRVLPVLVPPHVLAVLVRAQVEVVHGDEKPREQEQLGRLLRVFNRDADFGSSVRRRRRRADVPHQAR